ncbi:MAG: ArsR/SmtB family transcription factor [Planktomarina sp.]
MDNNIDTVFAALADPTRRQVIERLSVGPASVGDLHQHHQMALPSFMKHLAKLENAGLIRSEKKGRVRTIHIEAEPLNQTADWINAHRQMWEGRMDKLAKLAHEIERSS